MKKKIISTIFLMCCVPVLNSAAAESKIAYPTVRKVLTANKVKDDSLPEYFLDFQVKLEKPSDHFIKVGYHINPSAEMLYVFSRDLKLVGQLTGWALTTLSDEKIVYQENEVHFAPTHTLQISVFDPFKKQTYKIYPPTPTEAVRKVFTDRVAQAYQLRGKEWFQKHNYPEDPAQFDTDLLGEIKSSKDANTISFKVRYGNSDPEGPAAFTQEVEVQCVLSQKSGRFECTER